MKDYNCPNCGAPINGDVCEYCGTVFDTDEEETVGLYADNVLVFTVSANPITRTRCC